MTDSYYSPVEEFYSNTADTYIDSGDKARASYHKMRFDTTLDLLSQANLAEGAKIYDFGCGSGEIIELIARNSRINFYGCDISEPMVTKCREILSKYQGNPDNIRLGGVEAIEDTGSDFDLVIGLDVLPFLSLDDSKRFYSAAANSLKEGGYLLASHVNAMFDVVTLNRYTVEFYRDRVLPTLDISADEIEALTADLADMLTYPDLPPKKFQSWESGSEDNTSVRELVPRQSEDPFLYHETLASYGFEMVDIQPVHFHPAPPKLLNPDPELILKQHEARHRVSSPTIKKLFSSTFQCLAQKS